MGLSSSTQTQTSGPSAQALPYINSASSALQSAYTGNQANSSAIGSGLSSAFASLANSANGSGDALNAANTYNTGLLTGSYTPSSDLQGIMDTTNNTVSNKLNALFAASGQTGSSRQQGELANQLASADNALQYQDYNNYLQRQQAAASSAIGGANSTYSTLGSLGNTATTQPYLGAEMLSSGLGSLWGNSNTTTGTSSGSVLGSLGGLLSGVGSLGNLAKFSDRRLKEGIEKIGDLSDGLGVYAYRYKGSSLPEMGVMADEVAQLRPWALGPQRDGFQTVNYEAL